MISPTQVIGILGGMGPAASADFYRRLVGIAQHEFGADQDTDFPAMHMYNLPLSGFDETGFVDPASVTQQLISGVQKLADAKCDFIVIPCNTVHTFVQEMQDSIAVPILSIIEAAVDAAAPYKSGTIGILSSQSTRSYRLYESALETRGMRSLSATDDEQRILNAIIHRVMSGSNDATDAERLAQIADRFMESGAGAMILGCTELPLAVGMSSWNIPVINSSDTLARAALTRVYGSKG